MAGTVPLAAISVICILKCFASAEPLLVKTSTGWIQGKADISGTGKPVSAFLGIPYAEPPLGNLRFKPPLPVTPWEDVLNATSLPDSCSQKLLRVSYHIPVLKRLVSLTPLSEDCLKLNIWVPSPPPKKAATIVFIHGGGYSFGGSATPITLGDVLSSEEDVIVATLNYRLASFGFLYLGDEGAPGNAGLHDQRLALEWIHRNIKNFGGDPENLTLFGQSAGSSSVLFHLLSGKSDHVFQRLILSSAPRLSFVVMDPQTALKKGLQLVENVGCVSKTSNRSEMINCLHSMDADEIINNEPGVGYNNVIFYPVVDDDVVVRDAAKKLSKGKFKPVDVLMGTNKNEGTIFLMVFSPHIYQPTRDEAKPVLEDYRDMLRLMEIESDLVNKAVEFHYMNRFDLDKAEIVRQASEETVSDALIVCPSNRYSEYLSGSGKSVYKYYFTHFAEQSQAPKWFGVFHGSDLFYTLGNVFTTKAQKSELDFAKRIMNYWSNFARTGNPNEKPDGAGTKIAWPKFDLLDQDYLVLSPNSTSVGKKLRAGHCAHWEYFLPLLAKEIHLQNKDTERLFGL